MTPYSLAEMRPHSHIFVFHAAVIVLLTVSACRNTTGPDRDSQSTEAARMVKVVSLAPALTQIARRMGLSILGHTIHCQDAPGVVVGDMLSPSVERIVALHPDAVLAMDFQKSVTSRLEVLGIRVMVFRLDTFSDIEQAMKRLGRAASRESKAREMIRSFRNGLLRRAVCPGSPHVLLVVGRATGRLSSVVAASGSTFLGEALRLAGGVNVLDGWRVPYPRISLEFLRSAHLDAIVDFTKSDPADWSQIEELRHTRVIKLSDSRWTIPGPEAVNLVDELHRRLCR